MKTFLFLLPILGLTATGYAGQTNQLDFKRQGAPAQPSALQNQGTVGAAGTNALSHSLRVEQKYSGVLPEVKKKKSLFFKSPPPAPGREFRNVSVDPLTGRADGVILFSINF